MSLNNREILIWNERLRFGQAGGWVGFKVRLGLGETERRDRETEIQR
jgi:hypothetical protein